MTNKPKIIGITGNIATGKSVVGHMLANSGGLEIDADAVANRMLYPNGPAYVPVIETFGEKIIREDGQISREALGKIVFSDSKKLQKLESLTHPAVTSAVQARIKLTKQPFVAIEAIKLLESSLVDICDQIWVSHASVDHQIERLMTSRNLPRDEVLSRMKAQKPQSEKLKRANVVINTEGTFENTWKQVRSALNDTIQINNRHKDIQGDQLGDWIFPNVNALSDKELARFWQRVTAQDMESLFATLGSNIAIPFMKQDEIRSLLLWKNWNFSAVPSKWIGSRHEDLTNEFLSEIFISHVENQECEVILFSSKIANQYGFDPFEFGFECLKISELNYPAWQEAAAKIIPDYDVNIWMKILRQPIEANQLNNFEAINV